MKRFNLLFLIFLFAIRSEAIELKEYSITIASEYLDSLYASPASEMEYPAILDCSSGTADCMVRFRGRTSIQYPKKSWAINLLDSRLLGRERLNLNSEYWDPGMFRNYIAMRSSELMGLPASRVEHIKLFVNGEYMGVFLDVERVDSYYFERYDENPIAIFKAHEQTARFMPLLSGVNTELVYLPKADSETSIFLLENFIDCINSDVSPLPVDIFNVMGFYAVALSLMELDTGSNNYFIVLCSDGKWRIYPWDRGICLGGGNNGEFYPNSYNDRYLPFFRVSSFFQNLIKSPENCITFSESMLQMRDFMEDEIPFILDSVYTVTRTDLIEDPYSPWTEEQLDEAYSDLQWFLAARVEYLSVNTLLPKTASIIEFEISDSYLEPEELAEVRVLINNPFINVTLKWLVNTEIIFKTMEPVPGNEKFEWVAEFEMPYGVSHCPLSIYFNIPSSMGDRQYFFYPSYTLSVYNYIQSAHPSFVRVQHGSVPPDIAEANQFSILAPRVYGVNLWALPIVNHSSESIDISGSVFLLCNQPVRAYSPMETVLPSQDTLFLTNSFSLFNSQFPGKMCVGNLSGFSAPSEGSLTMLDAGWQYLWTKPVPQSEVEGLPSLEIIISEINCMSSFDFNYGDWIELYNPTLQSLDIGGYVISDKENNQSMIPMGTTVQAGSFIVLAREPYLLQLLCNIPSGIQVIEMGFNLNSACDTLSLFDRAGNQQLEIGWTIESRNVGVLGLINPGFSVTEPTSWELAPFPGSPGCPNRLWQIGGLDLEFLKLYPNPVVSNRVNFEFLTNSWPVQTLVYDISGRLLLESELEIFSSPKFCIDLPADISTGIYFLVLRCAGQTVTCKFTKI